MARKDWLETESSAAGDGADERKEWTAPALIRLSVALTEMGDNNGNDGGGTNFSAS